MKSFGNFQFYSAKTVPGVSDYSEVFKANSSKNF